MPKTKFAVLSSLAFLVIIDTFCAHEAAAQIHSQTEPIQISGQVRYANDGSPVNEVIVRLERISGGFVGEVRTDRLGKFRFQNLSPVQYHVVINHPGYKEIQREVNLVIVSSEYLQLQLIPDTRSGTTPSASPKTVLDASIPFPARKEFERAEAALASKKRERITEGVEHLERAVSLYPNFLEALLKLGAVYMDLQQWDKAEHSLRLALEINPRTANAFFALGEIYWRQKKFEQAEKLLREGLSVEERSWRGHFTLGRLYWSRGDIAKAGRQVALAIQLNPNLAEAHLLAGNILLRANKREDAMEQFQEYLRLAPKGEFVAQVQETLQKLKQLPSQK